MESTYGNTPEPKVVRAPKAEPLVIPAPKAVPVKETIAGKEQAKADALVPVLVVKQDPSLAPKKASEYFDEFFGLAKDLLKEAGKDEEPNVVLKALDKKHYQRVILESMAPEEKWPFVAAYAAMAYATSEEAKRIAAAQSVIDFKVAVEIKETASDKANAANIAYAVEEAKK